MNKSWKIIFALSLLLCVDSLFVYQAESKVKSVSIKAKSSNVQIGKTLKFTAVVKKTGTTSKDVIWSISGIDGIDNGTIDETGLYIAPSAITYTKVITEELGVTSTVEVQAIDVKIKATSVANNSKTASKKVTVYNFPAVLNVSVKPSSFNILFNKKQTLTASVTKKGSASSDVTWHLLLDGAEPDGDKAGKINPSSGKKVTYTAPTSKPKGDITIIARSEFDKTREGVSKVKVIDKLVLSGIEPLVNLGTVTIGQDLNYNRQFSVLSSSGDGIGWQVSKIPSWVNIDPISDITPSSNVTISIIDTGTLQPGQNIGEIVFKSTKQGVRSAKLQVIINAVLPTEP